MSDNTRQKIQRLLATNNFDKAIPLLELACEQSPRNPELYYLLGCSLARTRQNAPAELAFRQCLKLAPDVAQTYLALSGVMLSQERVSEAADNLQAALDINADLAEAHVALAGIQIANRDLSPARKHLDAALRINPEISDAHLGLGRLEQEFENHPQAIKHFKRALEYNRNSVKALCGMGSSIVGLARMSNDSRVEEALPYYEQALQIEPECIDALAGIAIVYEFIGDIDKVAEIIEPVLTQGIRHAALGLAFARVCGRLGRCREAIDYMLEILKKTTLSASTRKCLYFAIAKIEDRQAEYDKAFSYYEQANSIVGFQGYDTVAHANFINEIKSTFTHDFFMRVPVSGNKSRRPVFIVGMPRSGTSLTEQILAAHPEVYGAGELMALSRIVSGLNAGGDEGGPFPRCAERLDQKTIDDLSSRHLQQLAGISNGAARVTDKMPHNFYYLGLIRLLFPDATIIHCRRDPLDTCLSIYFQDFNDGHEYARDLFAVGAHYNQYQVLMDYWMHGLGIPMLTVTYEELVGDQEGMTRTILDYCGLDWDERCMSFHSQSRTVNTPSYEQVRKPLYADSVGRWKHYEKYLEPLRRGLKQGY